MLDFIFLLVGGLAFVFVYRMGLKEGLNVAKGKPIEVNNPVVSTFSAINEAAFKRTEAEKQSEYMEGLRNLFSYDGNVQKGGKLNG